MPLVYPVAGVIFFQLGKNPEPTWLSDDHPDSTEPSEIISVPPIALT